MMAQTDLGFAQCPDPANLGPDGRRAWFWQDGSWQVGRAWEIRKDGLIGGMCRDYGSWDSPLKPREPLQTHGFWPAHEVAWKRPAEQNVRPCAMATKGEAR